MLLRSSERVRRRLGERQPGGKILWQQDLESDDRVLELDVPCLQVGRHGAAERISRCL